MCSVFIFDRSPKPQSHLQLGNASTARPAPSPSPFLLFAFFTPLSISSFPKRLFHENQPKPKGAYIMKYLCLVYFENTIWDVITPADNDRLTEESQAYDR